MENRKGFTLVEGLLAMALLGVVLAALFLFIQGTGRATENAARQAAEAEAGLVAARLEVLLSNAGYMGDVFPGEWCPVLASEEHRFTLVTNLDAPGAFGPEDTITVASADGMVTVRDAGGRDVHPGFPGELAFRYFDASGNRATEPALVRRIDYTLSAAGGAEVSGSVSPYNLAAAGDPAMLRDLFASYGGDRGSRYQNTIFLENFEVASSFAFQDFMEAGDMWVPVITEYFEDPVSWNSDWQLWIEDDGYGRIRRWTDSEAYEGASCMALDCHRQGYSTQMAIWKVDLSGYTWSDELRLHFFWREFGDVLDYEDGVFLPVWVPDSQEEVLNEDFGGFRDGFPRSWTFWTNDYGRVQVTEEFPATGPYLNLDTRRQGYTGTNRVMATLDLSAYAGSDIALTFDMCNRGDITTANDFVGIMGSGGITSTPLAQVALNPGAYPPGSWSQVVINLSELIPEGYDLANTRIVFAQQGTGCTVSPTGDGGISIDNVVVSTGSEGYWDMSHRIIAAPESFPGWTEATVNLTQAAQQAGIPFTDSFLIGFAQRGDQPMPVRGIAYDQIAIEEMGWGMAGWSHGPWPGYTTDEWVPSNHAAYSGSWCYATAGSGSYQQTPTRAWLQSPVIDLSSYPEGQRLAVAFFHRYSFGSQGDGCNVKITDNNGETWQLIVPYWGYYTAAVPALEMEPGWTGSTSGTMWNFSVIDITEYAGKQVRLRFNYGTVGNSSNTGWEVDYTRSRPGADWPQIIWNMQVYEMADWMAYTRVTGGSYDPLSTPDGQNWAGNDMYSGYWSDRWWNYRYENSQHNALITPPMHYTQDNYDTYAYVEFYACPRFESGLDYGYVEVAEFGNVAPSTWHPVLTTSGVSAGWGYYRYRVDNLPVFGSGRKVIFRWRMLSNSANTYGGWNIDGLRFFTSDTWLSNVTHGAINGRSPGGFVPGTGDPSSAAGGVLPTPRFDNPVVLPLHDLSGEVSR
jgi:prepilin-type N-terminal cleavage/methylation domain-containing protein